MVVLGGGPKAEPFLVAKSTTKRPMSQRSTSEQPMSAGLTGRRAAFVRKYLQHLNATAAHIRAGYKDTPAANKHAHRLLIPLEVDFWGGGCCHSLRAAARPAARTMATMPARKGSGSVSQRPTSRAKSVDFLARSAKHDAKTTASSSGLASDTMGGLELTAASVGLKHWF
jgi:hypothetical protein